MVLVNGDKCLVCEGRFSSIEATVKHYKEQHLNFSYICDVCEMYFQHSVNLDRHYVESHVKPTEPSTSAQSPGVGDVRNTRKRTASVTFNEVGTTVADSSNMVSNESDEIRVLVTFNPSPAANQNVNKNKRQLLKFASELFCGECDIHFTNVNEIRGHFNTVHGFAAFFCDKCNSAYSSSSNMFRHARNCKVSCRFEFFLSCDV